MKKFSEFNSIVPNPNSISRGVGCIYMQYATIVLCRLCMDMRIKEPIVDSVSFEDDDLDMIEQRRSKIHRDFVPTKCIQTQIGKRLFYNT